MNDIPKAERPNGLSVEQQVVEGIRVVAVRGEIDHDVKDVFRDALLPQNEAVPPSRIVLDLSEVTFMDSSGINVLVAAHRAVAGDGWLRIAGAQPSVLRVLLVVGIDEVISCHATVRQAMNPGS
ncbi:STAS domain-containing protein [Streptomyces phaeoluteigriseus]|uniref:Anti-sigma factor antagonist n=1 Tax=Streptomyces phaeoluteigriseus TaxID=114686 RepID=A0ABY4Z8Q3_9ACTN|nr:STAS domain-containing protein [Streptomyces phaeoluteigriseus]USQ85417.1 STAS domain-containing protein [Streptomyces phaeoluteigriseus]